jgi:hypothetical protein
MQGNIVGTIPIPLDSVIFMSFSFIDLVWGYSWNTFALNFDLFLL